MNDLDDRDLAKLSWSFHNIIGQANLDASTLLGRGDSVRGEPEEITLGSGLVMTGRVLSAPTGGAGTVTSIDISVTNDDTTVPSGGPVTASGTIDLAAVDAGADKLVGWDDSAGKRIYFTLGTGLSTTGTTLNVSTGGTVTSVALALASDDTVLVSGSPVTTSGTLTGTSVDAGVDALVGWDDSAGKKVYFTLGTGLTSTGTVLSATSGSGTVTSVALTAPDIFTVSGSPVTTTGTLDFTPTDPGADRIVFWDESANKWAYLTASTGLTITGTTLTAAGSGGTVTSVALAHPSDDTVTVSGTPVTSTGTLTVSPVDAAADALVGWDDSAGKKVYFTLGTNLSTSGTTLNAGGGGHVIQEETTPVTQRANLNFTGNGVTVTDNAGTSTTDVTIGAPNYQWLQFAVTDQSTVITTGTGKFITRLPACEILELRASLKTASSSGAVTVDINAPSASNTLLSTKLTIDVSELTSLDAATPHVFSDTTIADDEPFFIDIDTAGVEAYGLIVTMKVRWT